MTQTPHIIQLGFPENLRSQAAQLYFSAFENKLGPVLGRDGRGLAFIETIIDPNFCLCALSSDKQKLLGIAGFKTNTGSMVGGKLRDLTAIYGWFGGMWRAMLLGPLERDLCEGEFLMDGIAVAFDARSMGIGSTLLKAIFAQAKTLKCSTVRLDVINTNERARHLYERHGFIAQGDESTGPFKYIFGFSSATRMIKDV